MFTVTLQGPDGDTSQVRYDAHRSRLLDEGGAPVSLARVGLDYESGTGAWPVAPRLNGSAAPGRKSTRIRHLKIQLGLKCNYACGYCLQASQPGHDEGDSADTLPFLDALAAHYDGGEDGLGRGTRIEFWGGEPFLYFKSKLRVLGLALKHAYPYAQFAIVTNGSVLSREILDWIDELECSIALSHDGPGQAQRGPDPLEDPARREWILRLHDRLAPHGRFSFNVTLTAQNHDLDAIHAWFAERLGGRAPPMNLEGIALPYTADGFLAALLPSDIPPVMLSLMKAIVQGRALEYPLIRQKLDGFLRSLAQGRPSSALGQKCGMDREESLAVTLKGDVLTCQNVSPAAMAMNGEPHRIGRLDELGGTRLTTATHWSHRLECRTCPVLQLCQGSCLFLQGESWARACDNEFAFNMGIFMAALYFVTGMVPVHLDGEAVRGRPAAALGTGDAP